METAPRRFDEYFPSMLQRWLQNSLDKSGIKQAEMARLLTATLGRSIDRAAVNKMLSGERKIYADELIETARICGVPMPNSLQGESANASNKPVSNAAALLKPVGTSTLRDSDYIQVQLGDLRKQMSSALDLVLGGGERDQADALADAVIEVLKERPNASFVVRLAAPARNEPEYSSRALDDQS